MTQDTKHLVAQLAFRFGLFCAWLVLVTFVTTISCIALFRLVLQDEQVKSLVAHSEIWRSVIVYSTGVLWMVLQVYLAFLLPARILRRWQRR